MDVSAAHTYTNKIKYKSLKFFSYMVLIRWGLNALHAGFPAGF